MSGLTLSENEGLDITTSTASREKMLPDLPAAKRVVEKLGASDLNEMIFGEDA